MTHDEFGQRLENALVSPMTEAQQAFVDARMRTTLAQAGRRPARNWRPFTTRTAVLVALLVLFLLPALFVVNGTFFGTESPFGLAGGSEMNREIEAFTREIL